MRKVFIILISSYCLNTYGQSEAIENAFDFWEGTWHAAWEGGSGTNIITRTTGGKVLEENFEITEGQNAGFKGISISVYNPRANSWHQAWADNNGGYFNFIGELLENKKIFKTPPLEKDDKTIIQRMVFHDIQQDSFTWDWEISQDGGNSWTLQWQINYTRK